MPLIALFGVLAAAFAPLVAAATGLPLWAGLLVAAGALFGVPLLAVRVVGRFSLAWSDRICEWHIGATGLAFASILLVGVGAAIWRIWRWAAG